MSWLPFADSAGASAAREAEVRARAQPRTTAVSRFLLTITLRWRKGHHTAAPPKTTTVSNRRRGEPSGIDGEIKGLGHVGGRPPLALLPAVLVGGQQAEDVAHRPQGDGAADRLVALLQRIGQLVVELELAARVDEAIAPHLQAPA